MSNPRAAEGIAEATDALARAIEDALSPAALSRTRGRCAHARQIAEAVAALIAAHLTLWHTQR